MATYVMLRIGTLSRGRSLAHGLRPQGGRKVKAWRRNHTCPCRNRSRDNRRTLIAQHIERLNALSKTARRADVRPLSR